MPLFHATRSAYAVGEVVTARGQDSFYPLAVAALDAARPVGYPSRSTCIFAADELNFAYLFAVKQGWPLDQINLYEVAMDVSHRAPMAIVHAAQRRLQQGKGADALVAEYWRPTMAWRYFEVFGPQMTILGPIIAPVINRIIMGFEYESDAARAKEM